MLDQSHEYGGSRVALSPEVSRFSRCRSPIARCFIERKDGLDRTGRHTRTAIDAFVRMNIEHFGGRKRRFILSRVDAIRGHDTGGVLGTTHGSQMM